MAWTYTYDTNTPLGSASPTGGDDRIREVKDAIQERMNVDHYAEKTGTELSHDDTFKHKKITLVAPLGADPTTGANKGAVYTKDVSAKAELFWKDEDANVIQITTGGELYHSLVIFAAPEGSDPDPGADKGALYTKDVSAKIELFWEDEDDNVIQLTAAGHFKYVCDDTTIEYDDTNGLQLKSGQTDQQTAADDVDTTSATYEDMDSMSSTITTTGGDVLVMFSASLYCAEEHIGAVALFINENGGGFVEKHSLYFEPGSNANYQAVNLTWLEKNLTAAENIFKIQWKRVSGVKVQQKGTNSPRVLTVVELPF